MSPAVAASWALGTALVALGAVLLWLDHHAWELALLSVVGLASGAATRLFAVAMGVANPDLTVEGPVAASLAQAGLMAVGGAVCCLLLARAQRIECPSEGALVGLGFGVGVGVSGVSVDVAAAGALPMGTAVAVTLVAAAAGSAVGAAVGWSKLRTPILERVSLVGGGILVGAAVATGLRILDEASSGAGRTGWPYVAVVATAVLGGVMASVAHMEGRVILRELAGEVDLGQLPAWVLDVLPSYRRRVGADWWPERKERRAVLQVLCRLCWRRARLRGLPEEAARLYGLEVGRLRQRARALVALAPAPRSSASDEP